MAYTQTDIDNLKAALATGALEVEIDGRRVRYRRVAEIREVLALAEAEVQNKPTRRSVRARFGGFDYGPG